MKKVLLLISLLALLFFSGNACAAPYFRIIDVSPIQMAPNSEANFTATVKGLGSEGGYVQLIFKNVTPGISVNYTEGYRYVLTTGTRKFNCSIKTGNIPPGNYSFDIGIYAPDAKINWRTAYVEVEPASFVEAAPAIPNETNENKSMNLINESASKANVTTPVPAPQRAPALGVQVAIVLLLLGARRRG